MGSAEFVALLDCDDWLLPGAVDSCLEALANCPDAVGAFTDEVRMRDGVKVGTGESTGTGPWCPILQLTRISYARHLMVMRRSAVTPYLAELAQWPRLGIYVLRGLAVQQGPWLHVECDGYVHREHDGNVSKVVPTTTEQALAAVLRVKPILMREAGRLRLGDKVEKVLKATGIAAAVKTIERKTGRSCGCGARKQWLNRW
jgi:hypothetical protein